MFHTAHDAREYALAGNATITVRSATTGSHFTYRLRQAEENAYAYYVRVLVDGQDGYQYLGLLTQNGFSQSSKSKADWDAPSVKAFRFFADQVLARQKMPANLEVRHMGTCGRCARNLTHPDSIDRGIGPECWSKMNGSAA